MSDATADLFADDYRDLDPTLLPDAPATGPRWPTELARLFDLVEHTVDQAPDPADRRALAMALCLAVARDLGGRPVYFPRGTYLQRALRDRRIYREFDGHNHYALAERYGLCSQRIYKIIAEQRRLNARQSALL